MKTFLKKNLVWAFALILGIGTMSFTLVAKSNQAVYWYAINGSQIQGPIDPDNCPGGDNLCAMGFTRDFDIPPTVNDGLEDEDYHGVKNKP